MSRRLGLIIGVNQYQDMTFRPLQYAENDARALAQWLVNVKGGKWAPPDVQLVQGSLVTRELTQTLIAQLCLQVAEPGDVILIYFAGHAFVDANSGEGYLALHNTSYQNPTTGLSLNALVNQVMSRSHAAQILVMLDYFQSGTPQGTPYSALCDARLLLGLPLLQTLQQHTNHLFFCSCRGNEQAPETGERNLGLLMYRTIIGLSEATGRADGVVTLRTLHAYLFGILDEQHRPQVFGQEQQPSVLVGQLPAGGTQSGLAAHQGSTSPSMPPQPPQQPSTAAPLAASTTQTATMPPPATRNTSGHMLTVDIDQQRQQQSQARLAQARQLMQANNLPAALSLAEQALQATPKEVSALILKGQILGTMGRNQEALETVERIIQLDPDNSLAWSMRAVALTNLGQHQKALDAIDRSLELDVTNPETYAIKTTIMGNIATQSVTRSDTSDAWNKGGATRPRGGARVFFSSVGLYLAGLLLGVSGALLLVFLGQFPFVGLLLASTGLTLLCSTAAYGTYRYGWMQLIPPILQGIALPVLIYLAGIPSLIAGGAARSPLSPQLFSLLATHPSALVPTLFLGTWLIVMAFLPLLAAIGGLTGRLLRRKR